MLVRRCVLACVDYCASAGPGRTLGCRIRCVVKNETDSGSGLGVIVTRVLTLHSTTGVTCLTKDTSGRTRTVTLTTVVNKVALAPRMVRKIRGKVLTT